MATCALETLSRPPTTYFTSLAPYQLTPASFTRRLLVSTIQRPHVESGNPSPPDEPPPDVLPPPPLEPPLELALPLTGPPLVLPPNPPLDAPLEDPPG